MSQPFAPITPLSAPSPPHNPYASPAPEVETLPPAAAPALPAGFEDRVRELFDRGKKGAGWFYLIAGLSLVNTIMILSGSERTFALGLGVTMIVDMVAAHLYKQQGAHWGVLAFAGTFDLIVLSLVVLCGWLSRKRMQIVFGIGMALYLLDGLLCLPLGMIIGLAIHAFALWSMWNGFSAYRQLNALETQAGGAL
jgi:hypothetical protein